MTPDQIESWVKAAMNLGSPLFTILGCIVVGYFFRAMPKFNNDWLWCVCGATGAIIFPVLAYAHRSLFAKDESLAEWIIRTVIMGLILGMGSWAFHDKILSRVEDKIPYLKDFVAMIDRAGDKPPATAPAFTQANPSTLTEKENTP